MRQWRGGLLWLVASGLGTLALFPVYMGLHYLATRLFDTPFTGRFFILGATDHPRPGRSRRCAGLLVCGAIYALPLAWVAMRTARQRAARAATRKPGHAAPT
ncbi:MAG: hypothetical protein U0841_03215 [Chloroflexia bacterium]